MYPDRFSPPGLGLTIYNGAAVLRDLDQIYAKLREVEELMIKIAETPISLSFEAPDCEASE